MVIGEILEGVIHVGDRVSGLGRDLTIAAIEFLTRADRTSDVALGFRYADEEDLAQLRQGATDGLVLSISAADSNSGGPSP